jgi:general secretion pathway protein M
MMQINSRERMLAAFLLVALAASALYSLALKPACSRMQTLQRIIPEKQAQLRELQAVSVQYAALKCDFDQRRANLASQDPDFQLLPFLEATIERHQLAQHATMGGRDPLQPQPDHGEAIVTIELHNISLQQVVEFLRDVDASPAVLHIGSWLIRKASNNEGQLDSIIEISSPRLSRPALASEPTP